MESKSPREPESNNEEAELESTDITNTLEEGTSDEDNVEIKKTEGETEEAIIDTEIAGVPED
eukprot:3016460-Ditylum_brightwellii.AAC.1